MKFKDEKLKPLTVGKSNSNVPNAKGKSFGYQVLGFGAGFSELPPAYIAATGGTVTTSGDFKYHVFTGPGTFCVTAGAGDLGLADYLVIAGGGGGGTCGGGGGGAGGFRESAGTSSGSYSASPLGACVSALSITPGAYPITVGAGGSGGNPNSFTNVGAANGGVSTFSTITSAGGGIGATSLGGLAADGGSGGGGGNTYPPVGVPGGIEGDGNTPPVSPPQGNPRGRGMTPPGNVRPSECGGGGGAGSAGTASSNGSSGGPGGNGLATSISDCKVKYIPTNEAVITIILMIVLTSNFNSVFSFIFVIEVCIFF